ncbi:MAG: MipA/OmpV family protein [Rhodocyclaceae bacterium]
MTSTLLAWTMGLALLGTHSNAMAQAGVLPSFIPNLAGAAVGVTPRYAGASDNVVGLVPGLRYQFGNTQRFIEWYGAAGDINLLDSASWQLGPAMAMRLGRSDVDDEYVARLPDIDTTVEAGLAASYTYTARGSMPWRLRIGGTVMTNLGSNWHGADSTLYGSLWLPLSERMFLGMGGGMNWSSGSFINRYYGISANDAAASGLSSYQTGGGMRQWYAWPALVVRLSPRWYGGVAAFYQYLSDRAADSPIVAQRGNRQQWTYGVSIGYVWH